MRKRRAFVVGAFSMHLLSHSLCLLRRQCGSICTFAFHSQVTHLSTESIHINDAQRRAVVFAPLKAPNIISGSAYLWLIVAFQFFSCMICARTVYLNFCIMKCFWNNWNQFLAEKDVPCYQGCDEGDIFSLLLIYFSVTNLFPTLTHNASKYCKKVMLKLLISLFLVIMKFFQRCWKLKWCEVLRSFCINLKINCFMGTTAPKK